MYEKLVKPMHMYVVAKMQFRCYKVLKLMYCGTLGCSVQHGEAMETGAVRDVT